MHLYGISFLNLLKEAPAVHKIQCIGVLLRASLCLWTLLLLYGLVLARAPAWAGCRGAFHMGKPVHQKVSGTLASDPVTLNLLAFSVSAYRCLVMENLTC